ncbi:hypothetical protein [Nostoc sp. C110]|uniref:hypothetical protein n=1 Tax=Nostoc sp. C110 TaxID=3349876 RepID=UPI00370DBF40
MLDKLLVLTLADCDRLRRAVTPSQLTSVALVHPDNVPAYNAMIATQLIPSDRKITSTQVMEIAAQSPVGHRSSSLLRRHQ